ncbi:hypothetical protein GOP56_22915 [Brevibacillus sp. 7WMA2]|uniref:hypothetical protein n=1 Tax=Brevibacillus TaxID=55080 RepID=UPI000BD6CDA3|nr:MULTISPECIES: hypothetical protein [Brevibacillus]PCN44481.1 hypothetical protein B9C88_09710 [Brevibacillus laterosporus]QIC08193.1 hypothetical protein GOP56_22915 [Brevibacillus sp. 7WMA2]
MSLRIDPSNIQMYYGFRIRQIGDVKVYLIDNNGTKRWITNLSVYDRLFRDREGVHEVLLEGIPEGKPIDVGTSLVRFESEDPATNAKVFWIDKDDNNKVVKRWVNSPSARDRYHFKGDDIPMMPGYFYEVVPDGSVIAAE